MVEDLAQIGCNRRKTSQIRQFAGNQQVIGVGPVVFGATGKDITEEREIQTEIERRRTLPAQVPVGHRTDGHHGRRI
jgi:hypothetical protein